MNEKWLLADQLRADNRYLSEEGALAHPIQIILTRRPAGYLSVPLFLVDPIGNLLFYNEPAEAILGRRFDETGAMPAAEWSSAFKPIDDGGQPIPPENLPLMITLTKRCPAFRRLHDPSHDDEMLDRLLDNAIQRSKPACGVSADCEGAVFRAGS